MTIQGLSILYGVKDEEADYIAKHNAPFSIASCQ